MEPLIRVSVKKLRHTMMKIRMRTMKFSWTKKWRKNLGSWKLKDLIPTVGLWQQPYSICIQWIPLTSTEPRCSKLKSLELIPISRRYREIEANLETALIDSRIGTAKSSIKDVISVLSQSFPILIKLKRSQPLDSSVTNPIWPKKCSKPTRCGMKRERTILPRHWMKIRVSNMMKCPFILLHRRGLNQRKRLISWKIPAVVDMTTLEEP